MRRSLPILMAFVLTGPATHGQSSAGSGVETVPFKSAVVGAVLPYRVILPPDYASSGTAGRAAGRTDAAQCTRRGHNREGRIPDRAEGAYLRLER